MRYKEILCKDWLVHKENGWELFGGQWLRRLLRRPLLIRKA